MIAIYPGSFDPVTNGHLDIIKRASKIANKLIVAVLNNSAKTPMFDVETRLEMLRLACKDTPNVEISTFSGLLVQFAQNMSANVIIKGLRAVTDFESEFQMALANRMLDENIETLFIPTNLQYSYLSSSVVKEVAILGGDVSSMLPFEVYNKMLQKIGGV